MPKTNRGHGYPYKILPFKAVSLKNVPPVSVYEFLLIEVLLRSDDAHAAYREGGKPALRATLKKYGVLVKEHFNEDPLKGTHHELLAPTSLDKELQTKLASLGHIDIKLSILNLGVRARLSPDASVTHKGCTYYGPTDGETECLAYLRDTHPRYLCLRLDTAHPPETIIKRLKPILRESHTKAKSHRPSGFLEERSREIHLASHDRIRSLKAWLMYFRCYDLQKEGWSIEQIANDVYGTDSSAAVHNTNKALQRVRNMIDGVKTIGRLPLRIR